MSTVQKIKAEAKMPTQHTNTSEMPEEVDLQEPSKLTVLGWHRVVRKSWKLDRRAIVNASTAKTASRAKGLLRFEFLVFPLPMDRLKKWTRMVSGRILLQW